MQVIAGLGNPGPDYAATRHNAGWMLLERLRERGSIVEQREKEWAYLERLKLGPDAVWLVRSKTYMNESGRGLANACRSLDVPPGQVLVAYDDVDLTLGTLRLRASGGAGGHRGLESIIASLGTSKVARLRLGVRGEVAWRDTAEYVLADFAADEQPLLDDMLTRAIGAIRMTLRRGLGAAMNTYNRKPDKTSETDTEPEEPSQ